MNTKPRQTTPQEIAAAADPDALLTVETVSALVGLQPPTIRERVRKGTFPAPLRRGPKYTRFRARDVRAWLVAQGEPPAA